jgi:Ca2+-transporting ATPase
MATDDLGIPRVAVGGVPDDNNPSSSSLALPSSSVDSSCLPPSPSTTENHAYLSPITPIFSAHTSGSVRRENTTYLRDNNPEEHDGSSYPVAPLHRHRRKGSIGSVSSIGSGSTTEQDAGDNSSFRLGPLCSAHSHVAITLPSPTYTHVRQPPPSPSRETDTGSDTTRYDGQKEDNADAKRKGAELARPATLDLEQEADLDVHPFAFKPLQFAGLVDPKSLETLESMGGVGALLRGLGTHHTHGLSTESGSPPVHLASPDPTLQSFTVSHDPPKPDIIITSPAGEPQGLQSTVSLGGDVPAEFQSSEKVYRTPIEDRQRIFGQNILPRRPSKSLLQLMWLALKDKVLVSSN